MVIPNTLLITGEGSSRSEESSSSSENLHLADDLLEDAAKVNETAEEAIAAVVALIYQEDVEEALAAKHRHQAGKQDCVETTSSALNYSVETETAIANDSEFVQDTKPPNCDWDTDSDSYDTEEVVSEQQPRLPPPQPPPQGNTTFDDVEAAEEEEDELEEVDIGYSQETESEPDYRFNCSWDSPVPAPPHSPEQVDENYDDGQEDEGVTAALAAEGGREAFFFDPAPHIVDRKRPAETAFTWHDQDPDGVGNIFPSSPRAPTTSPLLDSAPAPYIWRSPIEQPSSSQSSGSASAGDSSGRSASTGSSSSLSAPSAVEASAGPHKRFRATFEPVFEHSQRLIARLPPPPPRVIGIGASFQKINPYPPTIYPTFTAHRIWQPPIMSTANTPPRPTLSEQLRIVRTAINADIHPDTTWYILPARWYLLLERLASETPDDDGRSTALEQLATDLEALVDGDAYEDRGAALQEGAADFRGTIPAPGAEGGWQIKRGLTQMQPQQGGQDDVDMDGSGVTAADIVLIEQSGWEQILAWYGPVRPPTGLPRSVISRDDGVLQIELNPPTYVVFQARPSDSTQVVTESSEAPFRITLTADALVADLHDAVRSALGATTGPSRLWHIRKSLRELAESQQNNSNVSLRRSIPTHLLSVLEANHLDTRSATSAPGKLVREAEIESGDCFALELPQSSLSGEPIWPLQINERGLAVEVAAAAPDVDMATSAPRPLFSQPPMFAGSSTAPNEIVTRSKAAPTGEGKRKTPGLRGLTNLGNTCFMNSGLQCLSNTPELSQYFQSGAYTSEVNRANPLGMNGQVAEQFGALVEQIWDPNSSSSSSGYFSSNAVTPRQFKSMIGRYNSSFAGYGQQDTQELIAFLLDGLHEDLNRIHKKPYIEKPDWKDGGKEAELAMFAQECWEGYKKRNDSAIVDLFQGQLKSTLVCPDCHRVSSKEP